MDARAVTLSVTVWLEAVESNETPSPARKPPNTPLFSQLVVVLMSHRLLVKFAAHTRLRPAVVTVSVIALAVSPSVIAEAVLLIRTKLAAPPALVLVPEQVTNV